MRLHNKETDEIKGAGDLHGRLPAHDERRYVCHQRRKRVIVSQIVRSPGMYYGDEVDKADQHIYSATVIPYRGAWLEYETDLNNVFYVRIDKNRKNPHHLLNSRPRRFYRCADQGGLRRRSAPERNARKRTPAARARSLFSKSTASSVRASRPQSKAPRAIWTRCSSTHGVTTFPRSAVISSTRRWISGPSFRPDACQARDRPHDGRNYRYAGRCHFPRQGT